MLEFLKREKVDVVVACDMTRSEIVRFLPVLWRRVISRGLGLLGQESINAATREANVGLYAAGSYGYYGYVFADLGQHDFVVTYVTPLNSPLYTMPFSPLVRAEGRC
jgi:ubiquitin-like 1-activating enzyme E1 A